MFGSLTIIFNGLMCPPPPPPPPLTKSMQLRIFFVSFDVVAVQQIISICIAEFQIYTQIV